jgi:hypothetical protein
VALTNNPQFTAIGEGSLAKSFFPIDVIVMLMDAIQTIVLDFNYLIIVPF